MAFVGPTRAVQCPQCGAWCLLGMIDGFKVAASAQPLSVEGYRAALLAGLGVYWLTRTRRLKRVTMDTPEGSQRLLEHPCKAFAAVSVSAPPRAAQSFCKVRPGPGCADVPGVVSCGRCDPPPFEDEVLELFKRELKATVIEVIHHEPLA